MIFPNILFLVQFLLLHLQEDLVNSEPLTGNNIRDAIEREYPFIVSIGLDNKFLYADEKHICAGVLISRWHVLTAAHCLEYLETLNETTVQVTIGSIDLRQGKAFFSNDWITYDQWMQHQNLICNFPKNDIGIIKLTREMDEPRIKPARLWKGTNVELYGKTATMTGWGQPNNISEYSRLLQRAPTTIITNKLCSRFRDQLRPDYNLIHHRYLCTKADLYVLLECGDSGGPLIYAEDIVVAVNRGTCPVTPELRQRFPENRLNAQKVNLHTSVASYRSFIEDCLEHF